MKHRADFMLLAQVVAVLSLGMLCSSAPLWAAAPTTASSHVTQEKRSRDLVVLIIQEVLQDKKKLNLNAAPSLVTVNATLERCMQSHLETFSGTLAALDTRSKLIAWKLARINSNKSILPKDLDEECKTVEVPSDVFLETLENFLRLLSEKVQRA